MKFKELVSNTIDEFVTNRTSFSAYSITEAVRNKINNGVTLSDMTKEPVLDVKTMDTVDTYFISHLEVKRVVKDHMDTVIKTGTYMANHTSGGWINYESTGNAALPPARATRTRTANPPTPAKNAHVVKGYTRNGRWVNGYVRTNPTR